jgi:hypothetical protein
VLALWKNVQNIAKKNKASDTINKPTPRFNPLWTARVWLPKYVEITQRVSTWVGLYHS